MKRLIGKRLGPFKNKGVRQSMFHHMPNSLCCPPVHLRSALKIRLVKKRNHLITAQLSGNMISYNSFNPPNNSLLRQMEGKLGDKTGLLFNSFRMRQALQKLTLRRSRLFILAFLLFNNFNPTAFIVNFTDNSAVL